MSAWPVEACRRLHSHRAFEGLVGVLGALGVAAGITPLSAQTPAGANASVPADSAPVPPLLAPVEAPLVLRGVTVVDVRSGRRRPNQAVTVVGTRIRTIEPVGNARVPKDAQVIDARGKYLIPGLWDMHVHVRQEADIVFPITIATGVTGILNRWSAVPLAVQKQWQREVVAGRRVGPRMLTPGPLLNGDTAAAAPPTQARPPEPVEEFTVHTPAEARRIVDSLHAAGADWIMTYWFQSPLFWAVATEARRLGLPVGGHVPDGGNCDQPVPTVDGRVLADSGVRFLDHGPCLPFELAKRDVCGLTDSTHLDAAQCAAVGQWYRRKGLWVVEANGTFWDPWHARNSDLVRRFFPVASNDSATRNRRIREAQAAPFMTPPLTTADWTRLYPPWLAANGSYWAGGKFRYLPMVIGSHTGLGSGDGLPGFAVHNVLIWLVAKFGVTPLQALQAATLNPAQALGAADSLGAVEMGKVADLVLLDADPLADIAHIQQIRAVVANGRYYDRNTLDGLLAEAERRAAR